MKRPSGFDRSPDPERRGAANPEAQDRSGPGPAEPSGGRAGGLLRRRAASAPNTEDAAPAAAPEGDDARLAPTIDLSEVRDAQARDAQAAVEPRSGQAVQDAAAPARRSLLARRAAEREEDPVRAAERRVRAAGKERRARIRRERKRFSAAARARRRNWIIAGSVVVALALFVVAGVLTPLMAVGDVRVEGASSVDQAEVEQALARLEGTPLALVDDGDVHRALEEFPLIQRYAVERVPPHTLIVRIEERVPVVSLAGDDGGYELYDAAGVLLGTSDAAVEGVPTGTGALEDRASPAFASAARALRDMPADLRARVASVTATSAQDVTFTLASGVTVLWGDADRTQFKSIVLEQMLTSLADRPVEQIDVSSSEAPVFR